jgi:thiol-disulfide isomerase/thioredoxin
LLLGLGLVVALAAVIAIAVSAGGGDDKAAAGLEQTQPATITGNALAPLPDGGTDPAVGTKAPEVRGLGFDGTPVDLVNDGKAKVVFFIAHWCPHCQREVPVITKWLAGKDTAPDVSLYAVATATSKDRTNYPPSSWLSREGWPVTTMADTNDDEVAKAFGLTAYPFFVAIDSSGSVVARVTGELSTAQLEQLIALANGRT